MRGSGAQLYVRTELVQN